MILQTVMFGFLGTQHAQCRNLGGEGANQVITDAMNLAEHLSNLP